MSTNAAESVEDRPVHGQRDDIAAGHQEGRQTANDDSRQRAWAYLSRVAGGPCAPLNALIARVGAEEAARAVRTWDLPPALRARTQARRHLDSAAADLETAHRLGGRLVTPDDPGWPAWRMLAFASLDYANDVNNAAPLALWVYGTLPISKLGDKAVAVVGARAADSYGESVTADIVSDLAADGWIVLSGAAFGIDAAAHRAALAAGTATVAVLACGMDVVYPAAHDRLLRDVAGSGLVVTEYPPGTAAAKHRFLARNRIVAGLSDGVLVVEAGRRSGARSTAKWARRLGRPAMAVPGPVGSAMSAGCHQLIRSGEAMLVSGAGEVIDEAGPLRIPAVAVEKARDTDALNGNELLVYEALLASGSLSPGELSVASGLPVGDVRAALPALELAGFAILCEGGWRRVKRGRTSRKEG